MIIRISNKSDIEPYETDLIAMYISCFSEYPWHEVFTELWVKEWFLEMLGYPANITLLSLENCKVVGATFTFSVKHKQDILEFLPKESSTETTLYLAETFVHQKHRRQGIASSLHEERIKLAKLEGFNFAIQRTNPESKIFHLIQKKGFKIIGNQEVVSEKKINGRIQKIPDQRVISFKKL